MWQSPLARYPLLRLLIPVMAGIVVADATAHAAVLAAIVLAVAVLGYVALRRLATARRVMQLRPWWVAPIALAALALGIATAVVHRPATIHLSEINGHSVIGRIQDLTLRESSMVMDVTLEEVSGLKRAIPRLTVRLSTRGCNYSLHCGDRVGFTAHLDHVQGLHNPDDYDYELALRRQGLVYTQHLSVKSVVPVSDASPGVFTLSYWKRLRDHVRNRLLATHLQADSRRMIIALVTGDNSLIDSEVRHNFSMAGIAHVLALSGMHVGIIALIVWFLLMPLDYLRLRRLRLALTIATLGAFALFTGLSASVVRATLMVSLAMVGLIAYRKTVSINSLALAALIILLFSPNSLYNAGFQLSFATVASLLVMLPELPLPSRKRRVSRYIAALVATSAVAMLATVVLTAYHFHSVSYAAVLTNLFTLPVIPPLMACGGLLAVTCLTGIELPALNWCIDTMYNYIDWMARHVTSLSLSHQSRVWVDGTDVVLYYALLVLLLLCYKRRHVRYAIMALGVVVIGIFHKAYHDYTAEQRGLVVFNEFRTTPVLSYDNGEALLWEIDGTALQLDEFESRHAGFLAHHRIGHITLCNDTIHTATSYIDPPLAHLCGTSIAVTRRPEREHPVDVDIVIMSRKWKGTVQAVDSLYGTRATVLVPGSIYDDTYRIIAEQITDTTRYYDMRRRGAWIITR